MVFLSILTGIAVPAGIFAVWEGVSRRRRKLGYPALGRLPQNSRMLQPHSEANSDFEVVVLPRREIRWISVQECESLMSADPVFVSVQKPGTESAPPIPGAQALFVQPGEVERAMRDIPAGRCIILCGEVDLTTTSKLEATEEVVNAHAIYALKRETICAEVA